VFEKADTDFWKTIVVPDRWYCSSFVLNYKEDSLGEFGMSANAFAIALGVPATRIHEIVNECRSVTAETAQRLARYFGGDPVS
jgi:hypothetical protein